MKLFSSLLLMLLLSGCVMVPTSRIQIGGATLRIPKNIKVTGLTVTISGSNVTVVAQSIESVNDPAVIDKTSAAQVAIISALGETIAKGIAAAPK